jgi:glycine/D-amino acid oxidase-like deaminating enzyme
MFRSKLTKKLKIRIGKSFFEGPEASSTWAMDEISPFEKTRVLEPAIDAEWLGQAIHNLTATFPELKGIRVVQAWAGLIDTTPDLVPVITEARTIPGLIIASGFSGHGFGLGPGAGKLVSQMVLNETPYCDIAPFSLSRFDKGQAIRRPELM